MIFETLVGAVLACSYLVGALIYFGTKDECPPFAKKYKVLHEVLTHNFYLIVIAIALVASWLVTTAYKEAAVAVFIIPIIQMSFASVNKKNKEVILLAVKAAVIFIVIFGIVLLVNYLRA